MILFLLLIIKFIYIISDEYSITTCSWKCSSCVTTSSYITDDYHHNCAGCIDNTNFMVNSTNCYYSHELPGLYLDSGTNKYEYCSTEQNCYECFGASTTCKSCLRGSEYDENTNTCRQCDINYYMKVIDGVENCQGKEQSTFTCKLKITKCTDININTDNFECPRDYPLLFTDASGGKQCSMEIYDVYDHVIFNQIIKTQWLNNRIKIGIDNCLYITFSFSSQGDLIIETNIYKYSGYDGVRYFYGIKSNGVPLFNGNEQININSDTTLEKLESQLIKIVLDDKEDDYYLSICSKSIEITILDDRQILSFSKDILFGSYPWSSKINSLIELKSENKVYFFGLIADNGGTNYVYLYKYKFLHYNFNDPNNFEKIVSSENTYIASPSRIISCIEISDYNIVQCFYINVDNYYIISLFNTDSLTLVQESIRLDSTSLIYTGTLN